MKITKQELMNKLRSYKLRFHNAKIENSKLKEKLAVAVEALEFTKRHGLLCGHDDPTWCEDKCLVVSKAKKALAKIRGEK